MTFYTTIGYKFKLSEGVQPAGSLLLSGALPMHQLERRQPQGGKGKSGKKKTKHRHMEQLLFDPQLYLARLDPNQADKQCAKLATYPWFGVESLPAYDSGEQKQADWMRATVERIRSVWRGQPPTSADDIRRGVRECVDLQVALGCEAVILPSPLTYDPSSTYEAELSWLDEGLAYARGVTQLPIVATVALADVCLRYADPDENQFLELIADAVSARGADGVLLVVEQGSEAADTRQCGSYRVLASVLHMTHLFQRECGMTVLVSFLGFFGLACQAAGASMWSCGWYKSLHRLRLADQGAPGRAFPSYWSKPSAIDVNLEADFDHLVEAGMLSVIEDRTPASEGLITAATRGRSSNDVPAWIYSQSNVTTCTEHFYQSAIAADAALMALAPADRIPQIEAWLANAVSIVSRISDVLGSATKTRANHVQAWLDAVRYYRRIHRA